MLCTKTWLKEPIGKCNNFPRWAGCGRSHFDVTPGCQSFVADKTTMAQWSLEIPHPGTQWWETCYSGRAQEELLVPRKCKALVPLCIAHVDVPVLCCGVLGPACQWLGSCSEHHITSFYSNYLCHIFLLAASRLISAAKQLWRSMHVHIWLREQVMWQLSPHSQNQ